MTGSLFRIEICNVLRDSMINNRHEPKRVILDTSSIRIILKGVGSMNTGNEAVEPFLNPNAPDISKSIPL